MTSTQGVDSHPSPQGPGTTLDRRKVEPHRQNPDDRVPRIGQDRPRLLVAEGIELTTPADPYLNMKALSQYSGCSVRWLRDRLTDPHHPLPCYRVDGKLLVRQSDFDAWISVYRHVGNSEFNRIVADALAGLR